MESHNYTVKEPGLESETSSDEDDVDDVHSTFNTIRKKIDKNILNLSDPKNLENFAIEHGDILGKSTTEDYDRKTLLHLLVDGATDQNIDKYGPLVELIISKHPNILERGDRFEETSLYNAVSKKRNKLVRLMCNTHPDINGVLEKTCLSNNETCIHAAIHKSVSPELAIFLINKVSEKVLCHQDSQGNTPLHLAVEYKRCTEEQLPIVETLAKQCKGAMKKRSKGDAYLSPYLHHMRTRADAQAAAFTAEVAEDKRKGTTQGRKYNNSSSNGSNLIQKGGEGGNFNTNHREELKASGPSADFSGERKHNHGESLDKPSPMSSISSISQMSFMKHGPPSPTYGGSKSAELALGLGELPRDRKDKSPKTLNRQDTNPWKTERSKRKKKKTKLDKDKYPRVTDASADAIKGFLMLHCMRTMKTEDAVDFLYGKNQGKEICFDLCDQLSLEISEDQIYQGFAPLEFESVLQYVAFPNLQIEKSSPRSQRGKRSIPDGNGRDDMKILFEFLRKKKVRRIVRLIVADRDKIAHSDEAVEIALRGFEVEIWDWQKFDICTETIASAAPDVEEIHLYWSGNNAVLRGWSDEEVIERMKELKKIYLHTTQGLDTAKRTEDNAFKFKKRVERRWPSVSIELIDENPPPKHGSSNTHTNTEQDQFASRHLWLICMDDFADFMQNLHPTSTSYEPVKIALIDDGVDMKENTLHGKVLSGRSFCLRDEKKNLNKSFYVKSGGHGTAMASLICRVCPHAKLIVLKLDEYIGQNAERQITAKSAAKALQCAVERGADIISMSWTIERTDENKSDILALEQAVQDAANKGILMFCAASDGGAVNDRSFPAKSVKELLFKIGAATEDGSKWKWVGDATNIDFIFPGHRVVQERYKEAFLQNCNLLTGSSVATAIAAGLAALVLDCVQRAALHYEELLDRQRTLNATRPPQREGAEITQDPRDLEEESRLRQSKVEVDEAIQRAEKVLRRDYENLKARDKMNEAFRNIGLTENKYVMVWQVFQKAPGDAVGKTQEEKMKIVGKIAQRLKGVDSQD